jgi:3-oxoacyl-[acyl-carrier protein] reductase
MDRLKGKVAVITGGTSGFGYAMAELFVREGADVVITGRKKEKGDNAVKKIEDLARRKVVFLQCDVSKEPEVKDTIQKAYEIFKKIDILVNNAGNIHRADFEEMTEEEYNQMMDTNLKGSFFCCKHVFPFMVKNGMGSIICISSNTGVVGRGDVPIYSASKGGLILMSKSLALRWAKNNIRVNCICPSFIITDLNRHVIEKAPDPAKKLNELESTHPLGRLGTPMDVAYAAVYLASNESQWVTGIILPVDGGYTAG